MKQIKLKASKSLILTTEPTNILADVLGNRDSLMLQAQGDDQIAIYFTQEDVTNDNYYILNPIEWLFFNEDTISNGIWIKSLGADQKVVYQVNNPKF